MAIYTDITHILADGQPRTSAEILCHIPALSSLSRGEAALHLLLRLCQQVKPLPDDHWMLAATVQTPDHRIVEATQSYFQTRNERFALINTLAQAIAIETGYPLSLVKSTIQANFINNAGQMVINQLKEKS